jgi:hypothetical protein
MSPKIWIVGLLAAALAAASGLMFNQVSSLKEERAELLRERDAAVALAATTTTKVLELESQRRTAESRHRNLLLARNPLTGEPLFDKQGNPLYDTYEGSESMLEEMHKSVERLQTEILHLQAVVRERDASLTTLSLKTYNPGRFSYLLDVPVLPTVDLRFVRVGAGVNLGPFMLGADVAPLGGWGSAIRVEFRR